MHSIKQVEAGLLKYIDKELLPNLTKAGEIMLTNFCQSKTAQLFGVVSPDGQINIDVLRGVCRGLVPDSGLVISMMGAEMRFTKEDVDAIYRMIKEGV